MIPAPGWPGCKPVLPESGRPGFVPRFPRGTFFGASHTSDFQVSTPVATLPGAWRYRVSAGTGWPWGGILGMGEIASSICNFCQCGGKYDCQCRSQAWELAADPRISAGKEKCPPQNIKRSAQIRM